jgi:hypothetical membrane protein
VSAAALWITAGVGYLILEAIAAARFQQPYSYAHNYISELGEAHSPVAQLMNTAFYLQGTLFFVGAVLVARAVQSQKAGLFLVFAAMNAVGNIVVGTIHGGPVAKLDGTAWVHSAGAVLAIVGGNMAILAGSAMIRDAGAAPWYRTVSVGLAVLGLLSLAMLVVDSRSAAISVLPDGAWERGSVYSTIVWQVFSAAYLLCSARRHTGSGV